MLFWHRRRKAIKVRDYQIGRRGARCVEGKAQGAEALAILRWRQADFAPEQPADEARILVADCMRHSIGASPLSSASFASSSRKLCTYSSGVTPVAFANRRLNERSRRPDREAIAATGEPRS